MKVYPLFRKYVRNIALDLLGSLAKPSNGIHILNGHIIKRYNPTLEVFLDQLHELSKIATLIRIQDAIDLIVQHKNVDDTLVAFTFDDGFEECATMIAPALEQFNTNALFFINPNFVDGDDLYIKKFTEEIVMTLGKNPMRWHDIIDLQHKGHLIGAHTMDHFLINNDDIKELEYQIVKCKNVIENKINAPCDYFAFPYGRLEHANEKSIELAVGHYKYVFSQSDYKNYFSFNGTVINRRHFEPDWPIKHVKYFISHPKKF